MAKCTAKSVRTGKPCQAPAIRGATVCRTHGGAAPHVARKALVRAELEHWGLGDTTLDPGETLLRLVTQSAARVELYSQLLAEAYHAAEQLKTAHEAEQLLTTGEHHEKEPPTLQAAREDLERIFNTGGVAALIGLQYDTTKTGLLYATQEYIRGLADLEARERDRCAHFATKALAAGIAERQVRIAEQHAHLMVRMVDTILDHLDIPDDQRARIPAIAEQVLREAAVQIERAAA